MSICVRAVIAAPRSRHTEVAACLVVSCCWWEWSSAALEFLVGMGSVRGDGENEQG